MSDGLDAMTAMRAKTTASRRTLPPPRHQPRSTPVPMPDLTPAQPRPAPPAADPQTTAPQVPPTPNRPESTSTDLAKVSSTDLAKVSSTDLAKVSIYLDDTTDTYLETVRAAARSTRPRVDATRSAVVRLALTRLAEQLQPTEVVAELQRSAAAHTGPGRKRA
jgi:hypothetical protein